MSTVSVKRPLAQAAEDAEAFRDLFPRQCWERWTIAGSVRRKRPECGDVEHVVQPAEGDVDRGDGLFAVKERVNLLWHHLDALVCGGMVDKAVYTCHRSDGSEYVAQRWGDLYRGCSFRGFTHEIFTADAYNFGAVLLIRTGPADYSQRVVTALKNGGIYRQRDGYLWAGDTMIPVPDERKYLALAGVLWVEPEKRC